jgi:hypothetical protein
MSTRTPRFAGPVTVLLLAALDALGCGSSTPWEAAGPPEADDAGLRDTGPQEDVAVDAGAGWVDAGARQVDAGASVMWGPTRWAAIRLNGYASRVAQHRIRYTLLGESSEDEYVYLELVLPDDASPRVVTCEPVDPEPASGPRYALSLDYLTRNFAYTVDRAAAAPCQATVTSVPHDGRGTLSLSFEIPLRSSDGEPSEPLSGSVQYSFTKGIPTP